jgi:hypothetical protein
MAEVTFTFCDFCNPNRLLTDNGRGYLEAADTSDALLDFDWIRIGDDKICCVECQDEGRSKTSSGEVG